MLSKHIVYNNNTSWRS